MNAMITHRPFGAHDSFALKISCSLLVQPASFRRVRCKQSMACIDARGEGRMLSTNLML